MTERIVNYYPSGPVGLEFLSDESFICAIRGPVGSGKSVACCAKIGRNAGQQPIAADGYRHSRYAIIRNTMPELKSTTMATWHQWFPKDLGHWVGQGPPTHTIIDHVAKIKMEVLFVALDSPDDVKKVLSLELTSAWINEAREIPKAILDGLTGRVGRFNPDVGNDDTFAVNPQVIMDTNPPDSDHWWYFLAERDTSTSFGRQMLKSMEDAEQELMEQGLLMPGQKLFSFHSQPGAYSNHAENIENLAPGYYTRIKAGKTEQWIDVYINGNYGFVQEGMPVYPEYNDNFHCREIEKIQGVKVQVGLDFGLRPAAVFGQHTPEGQWRIYSEVCGEGMNLYQFCDAIKQHVSEEYRGFTIGKITGDPWGDARSAMDKKTRTTFQIMASEGINAVSAPDSTNNIIRRLECVKGPLGKLINGEPAVVIDPGARILRKGMSGGYAFKRVKISGDERYKSEPDKNLYSDPCDAMQYLFQGGGEWEKAMDVGNNRQIRPEIVETYTTMEGVM